MAKARAITKRRKAVQNIRKITATMQLIATARYQKCLQRAVASQPYTRAITEMIQRLAGQPAANHPLLKPNEGCQRTLLLAITSNRGLCGPYNASVLRHLVERLRELKDEGLTPAVEVVGKKGAGYLRFLGLQPEVVITDVEDRIALARVAEMAERYMNLYRQAGVARVEVLYMQFHSVGVQRPTVARLLPIEPPQSEPRATGDGSAARRVGSRPSVEFEFSPAPEQLLARLVPETVRIRLFQCFNDAILSEQVARMVAMKAATDAGGDMIKFLTRRYNRARQTQITTELADIVGGANAVR